MRSPFRSTTFLLPGLVLLALALPAGLPPAAAGPSPAPDPLLASLSGLSGRAFDVAYLRGVIPLHEEAVEIAMAATLNADHADLLKWNQQVVERKNAHVRAMLRWLQEAGGAPPQRLAGVATDPVKRMRALRGAALERAYLPLMAERLERTAALARLAAARAERAEVRAQAQEAARVESQEAAKLREWLRQWYGQ